MNKISYLFFESRNQCIKATASEMSLVYELYLRCKYGMADAARRLIEQKADIRGHGENSPLYIACFADSHECIRLLIEKGADADDCSALLYKTCSLHQIASLKTLLVAGVTIRGKLPGRDIICRIRDDKTTKLLIRALNWQRQWQRLTIITCWIRVNNGREFQYSVFPLVGEIMKMI